MPFRTGAIGAAALVICCVFGATYVASAAPLEAGPVNPGFWPAVGEAKPKIEGWPNALRVSGEDRNQTAFAISLLVRGSGGFPFDTPDAFSGNARDLSEASGWWGLGLCPRSVIIVAGDSPADALAAVGLSDATGKSSEPWLQRTAASDPLFDPIGGFSRVDTEYAPVVVTTSARQGATGLSVSATLAVRDLRQGGCVTARQAIVVGGEQALHRQVDRDLLALGIDEVFRIEGADRFETAALIAASLGTSSIPEGISVCRDASGVDGDVHSAFYANSVVEWRKSPNKCELLSRTVVLADGVLGADALAAGWWTSYWQVPVLLHDGSDALPLATAVALQTLEIDNLVVLGGTSRITTRVIEEAIALSSARVTRVSGLDRYATSVAMAEHFGGWWDTGRGTEFEASLVCLAGFAGSSQSAVGWPDALGAGAWCGAASRPDIGSPAPARALVPLNAPHSRVIPKAGIRGHNLVPILLTNPRERALPLSVAAFLKRTFDPTSNWCTARQPDNGCLYPGFAMVFGGSKVVADEVVQEVSELVGGSVVENPPASPTLSGIFVTRSEMTPVFRATGNGITRVCVPRGGVHNARWLLIGFGSEPRFTAAVDLVTQGWFRFDNDGAARTLGISSPGCVRIDAGDEQRVWVRAIDSAGRGSERSEFGPLAPGALSLDRAITAKTPTANSGASLGVSALNGETTTRSYRSANPGMIEGEINQEVEMASIHLKLSRGQVENDSPVHRFDGSWNLRTDNGDIKGEVRGEASYSEGIWFLRGMSVLDGESSQRVPVIGGFVANIEIGVEGASDDSIKWKLDGVSVNK